MCAAAGRPLRPRELSHALICICATSRMLRMLRVIRLASLALRDDFPRVLI
jgi:hypothetical protein